MRYSSSPLQQSSWKRSEPHLLQLQPTPMYPSYSAPVPFPADVEPRALCAAQAPRPRGRLRIFLAPTFGIGLMATERATDGGNSPLLATICFAIASLTS